MSPLFFPIISGAVILLAIILTFGAGKKALSIFPDLESVNVIFREKGASGYCNDSFITKAGAASGVLEVIVTDKEFWTRTGLFFGWVAKWYRLIHKIELNQISKIERENRKKIRVYFNDEKKGLRSMTLRLKNSEAFTQAIGIEVEQQ